MEAANFISGRGCFHQRHVWRNALVIVHVSVIAEPHWQLFIGRHLVDIAYPASCSRLESFWRPMVGNIGEPLDAALFVLGISGQFHAVTSFSNERISASSVLMSDSISSSGRGGSYR